MHVLVHVLVVAVCIFAGLIGLVEAHSLYYEQPHLLWVQNQKLGVLLAVATVLGTVMYVLIRSLVRMKD